LKTAVFIENSYFLAIHNKAEVYKGVPRGFPAIYKVYRSYSFILFFVKSALNIASLVLEKSDYYQT